MNIGARRQRPEAMGQLVCDRDEMCFVLNERIYQSLCGQLIDLT
jgi:hypothetical protein